MEQRMWSLLPLMSKVPFFFDSTMHRRSLFACTPCRIQDTQPESHALPMHPLAAVQQRRNVGSWQQ